MGLIKPKFDGTLPSLSNPAGAEQVKAGYQVIGSSGQVITGTMEGLGMFIAEYNVTSYDDVLSAYNNGDMIVCKRPGTAFTRFYQLMQVSSNNAFVFCRQAFSGTVTSAWAQSGGDEFIALTADGWLSKTTNAYYMDKIIMCDTNGNGYNVTVGTDGNISVVAQ